MKQKHVITNRKSKEEIFNNILGLLNSSSLDNWSFSLFKPLEEDSDPEVPVSAYPAMYCHQGHSGISGYSGSRGLAGYEETTVNYWNQVSMTFNEYTRGMPNFNLVIVRFHFEDMREKTNKRQSLFDIVRTARKIQLHLSVRSLGGLTDSFYLSGNQKKLFWKSNVGIAMKDERNRCEQYCSVIGNFVNQINPPPPPEPEPVEVNRVLTSERSTVDIEL